MRYRKFIFTLIGLLLATGLRAQIRVDAPSLVGLNENFRVEFTLSEKPSSFTWNPGNDFTLVYGPQVGTSKSTSIINGKKTSESKYTYTYLFIPKSVGTFQLPAAHATVGGKDYASSAIQIKVLSDGQKEVGASSQSQSQNSSRMFLRMSVSKSSVVVGEPITATLKLYTTTGISGFDNVKLPTFNSFWSQEVDTPQNITFAREEYNGSIYDAALLRRWVLIPQKAGSVTVDEAALTCLVQQRVRSNNILDAFFDDVRTIPFEVKSSPLTITVRNLPADAPSSFHGAVGTYTVSAAMDKDTVNVHDATSLHVSISGTGNVALLSAPKIVLPPDSEAYDVKTTEKLVSGSGGTSGSKSFDYPFIPRSSGSFTIDPVEFTYYDTVKSRYVTVKSDSLQYFVRKVDGVSYGSQSDSTLTLVVPSKRDVKTLNEDIHYITTKRPPMSKGISFIMGSGLYWILVGVMLILGVVVFFVTSRLRVVRNDTALVRTRKASRMARKKLAKAKEYLDKDLYGAFYDELHRALLGYASDKLNAGAGEASKDNISSAMIASGVPEDLVREFISMIDKCEYARYAPSSDGTMLFSYEQAVEVISEIDSYMGKSNSRVVKSIVALLVLIPSAMYHASAADLVDSLWVRGVEQYSVGNYAEAKEAFCAIEQEGYASAELYVNIADSYFKTNELGNAVLYYERALKLSPSDKDALFNLEVTNQLLQDRIESVPEFFLKTWSRKICYLLPSNTWAVISLVAILGIIAMVLVFLLAHRSAWKKTGFFGAIALVVIFVLSTAYACEQKSEYLRHDEAVVMRAVVSAKSSPSATGADLFVLHEGTKVTILDQVGDWVNISLADGREAWLRLFELEII